MKTVSPVSVGLSVRRELAMNVARAVVGVSLVILSVAPWAYGADDPNQTFNDLYGAEAAKVAATANTKDDAEFAQKLLAAAGEVKESPALQALLYDKAYASGIRGEAGYPTAVQAARLLGELVPARKGECDEKLLKVYELQSRYAKGEEADSAGALVLGQLLSMADDRVKAGKSGEAVGLYRRALVVARRLKSAEAPRITRSIESAVAGEQVDKEIARLQAQVTADKTNRAAAHGLLMLHLAERDDPNKAAELLPLVVPDQVLESYLPLVTKPLADLPEQAAWDLANWYNSLAVKAGLAGKGRMLVRAKTYCQAYLDLHGKDDAASLKAKTLMKDLDRQLAARGLATGTSGTGTGTGTAAGPSGTIATPGPLTPSKPMRADMLLWIKKRDALPPDEQVEAIRKKLVEVNGARAKIENPKLAADRIESMEVHASGEAAFSIAPLFGLKLTRLAFHEAPVESLEPLRGMPLKYLSMNNGGMKDLRGLEGMPLDDLRLVNVHRLVDIRALQGLKIKSLQLSDTDAMTDLRPLAGMPLEDLKMENNRRLGSLAPLAGMKLKMMIVSGSPGVRDVNVLLGMPLTHLDLGGAVIGSLAPLKGLKLDTLYLSNCGNLQDLQVLRDMPLRKLSLGRTDVQSFEFLAGSKVESLNLDGCKRLRDLGALRQLPLTELQFHESAVTSLAGLKGMKLRILGMNSCPKIQSLDGVEGMPLERLDMSGSAVASLEPLRGMPLKELQLSDCTRIRSLDPLASLPLETLRVKGTRFATAAMEAEMQKKIPTLKNFDR
jgi:hypothetical protein